jgi:xanthine/CO dehydrogenase XdhC/CoxF family maturation factor
VVSGGDRVAVAMVVGARRSAPRPLGTKMVVNRRGEIAGGVVAARHAHAGGRLSERPGRIHAPAPAVA